MAANAILIDDDPDDLDILKGQIELADARISCLTFTYPKEAVRVLSDELIVVPDYIFTDINMPDFRGEEVVKAFRAIKDFDDTTIVVLSTSMPDKTGYVLEGVRSKLYLCQTDPVVRLPSNLKASIRGLARHQFTTYCYTTILV